MANEVVVTLTIQEQQAIKAITALTQKTDKFGDTAKNSFGKAGAAFASFAGNLGSVAVTKGLALLSSAVGDVSGAFLEFSKATAEINSILPRNQQLTDATRRSFVAFSNSFSGTASTQAKAFYNIVSAGVQGTAKQLDVLKIANKAAVAGLVDIDTAAFSLVSSVNAYGESTLDAQRASDVLFTTVKEGQTTFGALASAIGRVAPLAAASGVKFAELGAALATVTKGGVSTAEATTGLRGIIQAIIKPTEEARKEAKRLGIEFNSTALKSKGLSAFLAEVRDKAKGNVDILGKLFGPVEALGSVIQLTGKGFEDFQSILLKTSDAAGSTDEAFKRISDSAEFQLTRLRQELQNLPQAFLVNFDKPIADAIKSIREFVGGTGLQLIEGAVNSIVQVFIAFSNTLTTSVNALDQYQIGINSAVLAIRKLTFASDKEIAIREKAIQGLKDDIKERNKANEERIQGAEEFNKLISDGVESQIKANIEANEKIKQVVTATAKKEVEVIEEKISIIDELEKAAAAERLIRAEEDKIAKEIVTAEEFEFLRSRLGEEAALQATSQAAKLANQSKFNEANKVLLKANEKAEKESIFRIRKFEEFSDKQKIQNLQTTLGKIATLTSSNNQALFRIGQAAAIAQAIISTAQGVSVALGSAPPPINFVLAALVGAAGGAQIATIASQKPPQKFQGGGIVQGPSSGDQVNVRANGGELILNRRQQENLFNAIDRNTVGGASQQTVNINGDVFGDDAFIDNLVNKINDAQEFRNLDLEVA